jgi:hypothetical protein
MGQNGHFLGHNGTKSGKHTNITALSFAPLWGAFQVIDQPILTVASYND